jgi:AcrR family transcriptional regulator
MTERDPFQARHVASRRGGPVKQPLSRDAIVEEALRQLTSNGLDGMSLRKVAAALDTGPASLYAYVEDLRELHALVLDRALGKVELPRGRAAWRGRLQSLLESYVRVLCDSPGLAKLAFGTIAIGPNALRITEALLGLLEEAKLSTATSAWAVDLLLLYVTAIAAEHAGDAGRVRPESAVARAFAGATVRDYPRLHAAREHLISGTGEQRFNWAVDVLVQGLLAAPGSPKPRRPVATVDSSRRGNGRRRES